MAITFRPLTESHFPLLLKWLELPHVKAWWDQDVNWTPELIQEKYASYVKGYKLEKNEPKEIHAFIICVNEIPIGYIQFYNAYDFPRAKPLCGLPESLAAFDIFIGEHDYLSKGIGSTALKLFFERFCDPKFDSIFADPESANMAAIRTYEKAGLKRVRENSDAGEIWMLR